MAHVLVADDDAHIREVVRSALEREGQRVTEAADGREALAAFETGPADLVVLDIVMPKRTASRCAGACASAARFPSCSSPAATRSSIGSWGSRWGPTTM
jgi:CheY-like chemotaxis protein